MDFVPYRHHLMGRIVLIIYGHNFTDFFVSFIGRIYFKISFEKLVSNLEKFMNRLKKTRRFQNPKQPGAF